MAPPPNTLVPSGHSAVATLASAALASVAAITLTYPLRPGDPCGPASPLGPCRPVSPVAPVLPTGPVARSRRSRPLRLSHRRRLSHRWRLSHRCRPSAPAGRQHRSRLSLHAALGWWERPMRGTSRCLPVGQGNLASASSTRGTRRSCPSCSQRCPSPNRRAEQRRARRARASQRLLPLILCHS